MKNAVMIVAFLAAAVSAFAQTATPPADAPSFKIGGVIFGDYTYTASSNPVVRDANGNEIHPSSFNISRAYINVTGNLNRYIAFRITPDIVRETGSGSSIAGSQTYRLKFAYAQFNLDQWLTKGSWIRAGLNQTPWIDYEEQIYRYRFQGPIIVDREGFLFASDNGASFHYNFKGDYGDVHAGVYNGEGWARAEPNGEKALQIRAAVRPMPATPALHGLRLAAFYDADHYAAGLPRRRAIGQVTFEHPRANAGIDVLSATDRPTFTAAEAHAHGSSIWATPKFGGGWEALLRHDSLRSQSFSGRKTRNVAGVAHWFPTTGGVASALMIDRDAVRGPATARTTNYAVHMLVSF